MTKKILPCVREDQWEGNYIYTFLTLMAFNPLRPSATSKETLSPELMFWSINPVMCKKISAPVPSSVMKPYPLVALKNFTVPVFIVINGKSV